MKFYLAARYSRHSEMCQYRGHLVHRGHEVTSHWIDQTWFNTKTEMPTSMSTSDIMRDADKAASIAAADLRDVSMADVLIAFTELEPGDSKGGRHVEFGSALSQGKLTFVVGPPENVFYALADRRFWTWTDLLQHVDNEYSPCT